MDIIAYQKAMKTKPAIKKIKDRLGMEGTESGDKDARGDYSTVKERLEELEKSAPDHILKKHVSDLEASTAINLNKHNLRVNSLLNQNKYRLKDMVFDDFADASGIDSAKSSNYVLDAAGKKVKQVNASLNSEVVTINETVQEVPQKVAVSIAFNEQTSLKKDINFNNGEFNETEVIDNKIKLMLTGSTLGPSDENRIQGTDLSSSPYPISTNVSQNIVWNAFNDKTTKYWAYGVNYIILDFMQGNEQVVNKLKIYGGDTYNNNGTYYQLKKFTISGSADNVTYDILYSGDQAALAFKEHTFENNKAYRFYKLSDITGYNGSPQIGFTKIEMYGLGKVNTYTSPGNYESSIVDLGSNFKEVLKVETIANTVNNTSVSVYTSTSQDGQSFSKYQLVNTDGTLATSGRYLKIKVELSSDGEVEERLVYDFPEDKRNAFHENDKILFNGAAKLKIEYSFDMNKDDSFIEAGILLRQKIMKKSFNYIDTVKVI
ncbi:hypothetical protein C2I27_04175 [Priestia megaterium]|uniref:hypothetical protein n=1 Tax=Priestia megaterium TaxID=1404 RepID=UPI000D515ED0|nr:hypothetical protein [Priestia megaterium]PVC75090.1 hypothetical protein C2I27_04175 [Priestia megaterium]